MLRLQLAQIGKPHFAVDIQGEVAGCLTSNDGDIAGVIDRGEPLCPFLLIAPEPRDKLRSDPR